MLAGVFMAVLDGVVVAIALPTITAHFGVNLDSTQWVITAYLLVMTVLLLPAGRIAEYTGRAPLFVAGLVLFTLASAACGFAPTLAVLIAARIVQGVGGAMVFSISNARRKQPRGNQNDSVGGAMVFSISNALIFEAFPPHERGRALGYLGSVVAIGSLASPVVGGGMVETFGWAYVFFINIPIGVVVVAAALRVLPRTHVRPERFSFDLPGAVALGVALAGLIFFLGQLADSPVVDAPAAACALVAVAGTAAFVLVERRAKAPLVDLGLFAEPLYVLPVVAMLLYFVAAFMLNLIGPFYFEAVMGFSPATVGLVFLLLPAVMVVTAPLAGWLYDRTRFPYLAAVGMGLVAAGYAVAAYAAAARLLVPMLGAFLVIGLGSGLFQAPNNTAQMSAVPRLWLGLASAITATGRNLGMSLGVSIGSVLLGALLLAGGNTGPILEADPALLASSFGVIGGVGAVLTGLAAALSALRGVHAMRAVDAGQPVQP
ncbi:MAG: MFS transporter [Methanospirillum sp.]